MSSCSMHATAAERPYVKEFELFVKYVVVDDLCKEKFGVFCWHLNVPRRLTESQDDRTQILYHLRDQCLIEKWSKTPAQLEFILSSVLQRGDLVSKLQSLVSKYELSAEVQAESTHSPVEVQATQESQANSSRSGTPVQETVQPSPESGSRAEQDLDRDGPHIEERNEPCCLEQTAVLSSTTVNKRPRKRNAINRERRHGGLFETVIEEEQSEADQGFAEQGTFVPCLDVETSPETALLSPTSPEKLKHFWRFLKSEQVRGDYGNKTVDGLISDFEEHYSSKSPSTSMYTLHPPTQQPQNHTHTNLSRTPSNASKASGRSSGYYSVRSSDARLSQLSLGELDSFTEEDEFRENLDGPVCLDQQDGSDASHDSFWDPFVETDYRARSSSLPSNSQKLASLRLIAARQSRYTSSSLSCTSLASDDSETTTSSGSQSQYSSQASLLDNMSTNSDPTTATSKRRISPEVRLHTLAESKLEVMGKMELSAKDILKDIKKERKREHKSSPFPPQGKELNSLQYEMRFYPLSFDENYATLYIDLAAGDDCTNHECVSEPGKGCSCQIKVPAMSITVAIHSRSSDKSNSEGGSDSVCLVREEAKVDGATLNSKFRNITSFPKLVRVDKLRKIKKGRVIVVEVAMVMEC